MRKFRLIRIDPIDVGLACGLMALAVLCTFGLFMGLGKGLEDGRWTAFLELPFMIGVYSLEAAICGFIAAIAFNIACYYMGGITITFREMGLGRAEPKSDEPPTIGPPSGTPDAE
jgi:hypothetical protein